jgi:hypothetical protein
MTLPGAPLNEPMNIGLYLPTSGQGPAKSGQVFVRTLSPQKTADD